MSETKMMTLWCEGGEHEWTRESRRGRPPLHCPEHTPEKPTVIRVERPVKDSPAEASPAGPKMRYVLCQGHPEKDIEPHLYLAESKRGRKPRWCEDHAPVLDPVERQKQYQANRAERKNEEELTRLIKLVPETKENVEKVAEEDDALYLLFCKTHSDEDFKRWIRMNSRLLGHVTALRAQENKIEMLCV